MSSPHRDGYSQPGGLPAVPIVLGVVGHINVPKENKSALVGRFREVFGGFRDANRGTPGMMPSRAGAVIDRMVAEVATEWGVGHRPGRFEEGLRRFDSPGGSTPLILLTGLAEGIDQLAAEVALDCGAFVRAALPFAPDVYVESTSFLTDGAKRNFERLIRLPGVEWFEVPLPDGAEPEGIDARRVATDRKDAEMKWYRHSRYANGGGYIVRRCHALIAAWDGLEGDPGRPSGTAEQDRFKLTGQPPSLYPWSGVEPLGLRGERQEIRASRAESADLEPLGFRGERGLVFSIHSPKDSASVRGPSPRVGDLRILMPKARKTWKTAPEGWEDLIHLGIGAGDRFRVRVRGALGLRPDPAAVARGELTQFRETCQSIRDFNRDVSRDPDAARIRKRIADKPRSFFEVDGFDDRANASYRRLSLVREAAAAVSEHLRPRLHRVHVALFLAVAASALTFHLYAHLSEHDPLWLWGFMLSIAAAFVLVIWDWWTRLDQRRLDARALGEGLRVRRNWAKAGIRLSVADSYAGQLRGELSWVRQALLHVCPPPQIWAEQFDRLPPPKQLELLREVRKEWIVGGGGQIRQFRRSLRREELWARLRPVGFLVALAGWLSAASLLLAGPRGEVGPRAGPPAARAGGESAEKSPPRIPAEPDELTLIASSLMVIFGGLAIAFSERQGHEELARQFERMEVVFRNGNKEFTLRLARRDVAGARRVIKALGREAIAEHAEWYMLRRARSLELHIG